MKYAPSPHLSFSPAQSALVRSALCAIGIALLTGCSTSKEAADAGDGATVPVVESAPGANGTTAGGGRSGSGTYVDPMVSTARGQTAARAGRPAGQPAAAAAGAANAFPEAPASIAGMTTQPTGVQAGSFSIFSSAQPQAQAPAQPQVPAGGSAQAAPAVPQAGAGVSAARRSVFSSAPQPSAPACGADAQGVPLSC